MYRIAIVSSHPIQYNAPVFRDLAKYSDFRVHVFFSWHGTATQPDVEFGCAIDWDIPLTVGYEHSFIENSSKRPGSSHFFGLRNPGMCSAVEAFKPDLILVYGWASATHLSVLRHFHGRIPVLFRGDSTLASRDRAWKAPFRKHVLTWVYSHVDRALYVGKNNRDYFRAHGIADSKLTWVPHSVDVHRFALDDSRLQLEADRQRAEMGIPATSCVYLFAGKFVKRKEPRLLIEAFKSIAKPSSANRPHLVLVGAGPLDAELRACAVGRDDIHFAGFKNQSEMPVSYRIGDVFVLPSSRETWGLAVNEAMACNRPVIVSSSVGCSADLAVDRELSAVFATGSCPELSRALTAWLRPRHVNVAAGCSAGRLITAWSTEAASAALAKCFIQELKRG